MSNISTAATLGAILLLLSSSTNPISAFTSSSSHSSSRTFERIPSPNRINRISTTARKLSIIDTHNLLTDIIQSTSALISDASAVSTDSISDAAAGVVEAASSTASSVAEEGFTPSYSKASYYTTLGLYVLSFPGIWSQVKRSTKAKSKRKTFESDGEATTGGKDQRQQAGEIMAYMKANNYEVVEAGEVITFRGIVKQSVSQACFLVFCTALGMASLALVLQIQLQDFTIPFLGIKPNWFYLVALGPYAGVYYWKSGDRVDDVMVKLASNDDDTMNEITVEGNDDEIERMWRTLDWNEKGMVKIEGLLGA